MLSVNETTEIRQIQPHDPTNPPDREEFRWYLELYSQQNPFSVTRARKAAERIQQYSKELFAQLQLVDLLESTFPDASPTKLTVSIEVLEKQLDGEVSKRTVHQIFWGLLEDPALWEPFNAEVLVQRLTHRQNEPAHALAPVQSWSPKDEPYSSLNVLLVFARDLSRDPAIYSYATPSLALEILLKLRHELKRNSQSIDLDVEVVRLGTMAALEEHLEKTIST